MKHNNMLKILASLAIVISMSACAGNKKPSSSSSESVAPESSSSEDPNAPREMTLAEVTSLSYDEDTGTMVADFEGQVAIVKGIKFHAFVSENRFMASYAVETTPGSGQTNLGSIYGIEVELAEGQKELFTKKDKDGNDVAIAYTDQIDVEGTITLENGKVVLKNAKASYAADGDRRNWYWTNNRSYYNYMNDPKYNGLTVEGDLVPLEWPTFQEGSDNKMQFVFPGEKTAKENNSFIIELTFDNLTAEEAEHYNEKFATIKNSFKEGETEVLNMIYMFYYDDGMQGFFPHDWIDKKFSSGEEWVEKGSIKGVYQEWEDALEALEGTYVFEDADFFENFNFTEAYNYIFNGTASSLDVEETNITYFDNAYRADVSAYVERGEKEDGEKETVVDIAERQLEVIANSENQIQYGEYTLEWATDGELHTNSAGDTFFYLMLTDYITEPEEDEGGDEPAPLFFEGEDDDDEEDVTIEVFAEAYIWLNDEDIIEMSFFSGYEDMFFEDAIFEAVFRYYLMNGYTDLANNYGMFCDWQYNIWDDAEPFAAIIDKSYVDAYSPYFGTFIMDLYFMNNADLAKVYANALYFFESFGFYYSSINLASALGFAGEGFYDPLSSEFVMVYIAEDDLGFQILEFAIFYNFHPSVAAFFETEVKAFSDFGSAANSLNKALQLPGTAVPFAMLDECPGLSNLTAYYGALLGYALSGIGAYNYYLLADIDDFDTGEKDGEGNPIILTIEEIAEQIDMATDQYLRLAGFVPAAFLGDYDPEAEHPEETLTWGYWNPDTSEFITIYTLLETEEEPVLDEDGEPVLDEETGEPEVKEVVVDGTLVVDYYVVADTRLIYVLPTEVAGTYMGKIISGRNSVTAVIALAETEVDNPLDPVLDPETGDPVLDPETGDPLYNKMLVCSGVFVAGNDTISFNYSYDEDGKLVVDENGYLVLTNVTAAEGNATFDEATLKVKMDAAGRLLVTIATKGAQPKTFTGALVQFPADED